jgi:hypothetical protein
MKASGVWFQVSAVRLKFRVSLKPDTRNLCTQKLMLE